MSNYIKIFYELKYRIKKLSCDVKYSFLKFFGWKDAFHNGPFLDKEDYDVFIFGKRVRGCQFKKMPEGSYLEGMYPYFVELPNDTYVNISHADLVLFLPWDKTRARKVH